jgi:hypothetical protein
MQVSPTSATYGDQSTLPAKLETKIQVHASDVIYWSAPIFRQPVFVSFICEVLGCCFFIPIFWPQLVIFSVPVICLAALLKFNISRTYVVLTNNCLIFVCGSSIERLELGRITSVCAYSRPERGCKPMFCMPDLNQIDITTNIIIPGSKHGPSGRRRQAHAKKYGITAHDNISEFAQLIKEAKEKLRNNAADLETQQKVLKCEVSQEEMVQREVSQQEMVLPEVSQKEMGKLEVSQQEMVLREASEQEMV